MNAILPKADGGIARERAPFLPLSALDALWFQVSGTLCNLRCNHCFISCAPDNHTLGLMTFAQFKPHLEESVRCGVKEYYFTGGEPFINPEIFEILEATLAVGPATVLTNATRFDEKKIARLAALRDASEYSLELRVSIDGFSPETNDPIRGPGTFDLAMNGVRMLVAAGFLPIITSMRSWPMHEDDEFLREFKTSPNEHRIHPAPDEVASRPQDRAGSVARSSLRQIRIYHRGNDERL